MKVYLRPSPDRIAMGSGIGQIVQAQAKYLPAFGVEFTDDWEHADIRAGHTNLTDIPEPSAVFTHGLYWSGDPQSGKYNDGNNKVNSLIISECMRARYVTVPSPWVQRCWQRDCHISPVVIGHGIDYAEWQPSDNKGYVLWGKARAGDVCDPTPAYELATRGIPVVSTFVPDGLNPPPNMTVMGHLTFPAMMDAIVHADVYLATTKETFGIQTLEAMAAAVPVLGYRWGGTADLIEHKQTGYLVEPHDVDGLLEGLAWLREHRADIGANCREQAAKYDWPLVIGQYADLFQRIIDERANEPNGVSIIITNFGYARFIAECIESVLAQSRPADEIIVVDDGSTDNSLEIINRYADRVRVIAKENGGVASARNAGALAATQPYLTFLDADDRLDPEFIAALLPHLQQDRGLGIAYSRMGFIPHELGQPVTMSPWFSDFDFLKQSEAVVPPPGLIPSACMFRRDLWLRAGGVKQDYAPGEDSEFWTRGLSLGFRARCVDQRPLFHYRNHANGAHVRLKYGPTYTWNPWMVDKQWPMAAPTGQPVAVRSYSDPAVAVIVVHPDLKRDWVNTLDKIHGQTYRDWECIAVLNRHMSSDNFHFLEPAYVWCDTQKSVADALAHVLAPLVLIVDNRYEWQSDSLSRLLDANELSSGRLIAGNGVVFTSTENARKLLKRIEELMACGCKTNPKTEAMRSQLLGEAPLPVNATPETKAQVLVQKRQQELQQAVIAPIAPGMVRMEYMGTQMGAIPFSVRSGRVYKGAGSGRYHIQEAFQEDVAELMEKGWRVVSIGQAAQTTKAFRYLGNGTMNVIGANGSTIGTVSQRPSNNFIRIADGDVLHIRQAYAGLLEEVGVSQQNRQPPVQAGRGVLTPV